MVGRHMVKREWLGLDGIGLVGQGVEADTRGGMITTTAALIADE